MVPSYGFLFKSEFDKRANINLLFLVAILLPLVSSPLPQSSCSIKGPIRDGEEQQVFVKYKIGTIREEQGKGCERWY